VRGVRLAPGRGGDLARQHVERAEHPFIIVQDKSGRYKPLFHEFRPKDGFSTVPMLMHGHPDDTPGGHLIMSEYDVHVRKQKEKRKAARAAGGGDEPPRREQRPERPERGGRQGGGGGASSSQAEQGVWAEIDEEIRKIGLMRKTREKAQAEEAERKRLRADGSKRAAGAGSGLPSEPWRLGRGARAGSLGA